MPDPRLDEARRLAFSGKLKEAATLAKAMLQEDPKNPEVRTFLTDLQDRMMLDLQIQDKLKRARSLADEKSPDAALKVIEEVLKIAPDHAGALELKAQLSGEPGGFDLEPVPEATVRADASDLLQVSPLEEAVADRPQEPAADELPELAFPDFDLPESPAEGTLLSRTGAEARLAPAELQRVRQYLEEGKAHHAAGRYQDAIDAWTRVFIIDEDNEEAQDLIDEAKGRMNAGQGQAEYLLTEGIAAFNSGDYERARPLLAKILEAFPSHREAMFYLGRIDEAAAGAPPPVKTAPAAAL